MEQLCDLLFEFSNIERVRILLLLTNKPFNITGLSKELDITTQETSRHTNRLSDVGLVIKLADGSYEITPYGKIILNQISGIEFINNHRDYFIGHSLSQLPYEFISRIGELKESFYINNVMAIFQNIQEICDEAEKFIWRITDKRLNIIYPNIQDAANRGVEYLRIEPKIVIESPIVNIMPPIIPGEVRGIDTINIFMAISEKEVGALAFPKTNGEFDYLGFTSKNPRTLKWCTDLFQFYWKKSKTKIF
jgi:predicted transcriptional regulator